MIYYTSHLLVELPDLGVWDIMLFGKRKKVVQTLDELWRTMEMSCENNYKDMAQDGLREYEETLEKYRQEGLLSPQQYSLRTQKLEKKKVELQGYNHKQHIGW